MRKLDDGDFQKLAVALRAEPDLLAGYCFGSQVDPRCRKPRDIDIALLGIGRLDLPRLLAVRALVTEIIASDAVDLVDMRQAGPVLKRQIIKSGRLLFARDQSSVNRFELSALREYQDSEHRRRVQQRYLHARQPPP